MLMPLCREVKIKGWLLPFAVGATDTTRKMTFNDKKYGR
jgi:hypothetical protein